MSGAKFLQKVKSLVAVTSCGTLLFCGISYYRCDEKFFFDIFMPLTRKFLEPETEHNLALFACKWNLLPRNSFVDPETLETNICGIKLKNPLGIGGFDKNGDAIQGLHRLGFGFVEIGTVCPDEQLGLENSKLIRLEEDEAFVNNRYGFNSKGHEYVVPNLRYLRRKLEYPEIIGVNMGINKWSKATRDYPQGVKVFSPTANYLVINLSCPNTPHLRDIQRKENLQELLKLVIKARLLFDTEKQRPIFIKISPDLSFEELKEIIDVTKKKECKIDGFIISNTTSDRNLDLHSKNPSEEGGLSGKPLREKSTKMIEEVYKLTNGKATIIGVGGISNGQDAYEKILAGASAIQIYTAFFYQGPPVVTRIKRELNEILLSNGFQNVSEAVGKGVKLEKRFRFFFWK